MTDAPNEQPYNETVVYLDEADLEHIANVAAARYARMTEIATRFARPDERAEIAARINPGTALVFFDFRDMGDPYDDHEPVEGTCFGREYFAVDPSDGIAIWVGDLDEAKQELLAAKVGAANSHGWREVIRPREPKRNDS